MQPEQQQRILGYFIEEARDHLNTIEQGLLNLESTLQDSEMVNEIFRAAHSIKGGAAMLGLNSIQRTSHRLEDFFKVLKECQSVQIDQTIESLFLRMFDNLQALLDQLQSESGLSEDVANQLMSEVEPVFAALEKHLELRVNQAGGTMQLEGTYEAAPTLTHPPATTSPVSVFQNSVPETLRQMLQLFKQPETTQTRQQLEQLCNELAELGEQFNLSGWCTLCQTAAGAIADNDNSYRTLAPIVIKEIKQAQELVLTDRASAIATCEKLQALSLKTFLSDCEDTSTLLESKDKQLVEMIVVDQQQSTELFSIKHNVVESELLTDIAQLNTQEQVADWVAEDNLSSLFALNSNINNQSQDSASSESINIENDLESSLIKLSKDNFPLISSEETSALNSLFDDAQDTSLDLTTAEPAFCDLFKAPEADVESLDLLEISTATSTENSDLSSLWASPDAPTGSELDKEEFSFPFGADDLFADSEELFTLPVVPSEANNVVDDNVDFALSNSSEPEQKFDDHWFVDPQSDLSTVLECTLSSDSNEILNAAVNATPAPTPTPEITTDLESSLTASVSNLFSSVIAETDLNLELFESSAQTGDELDFSLDSSTDLFNSVETDSNLELFESPPQTAEQLDFSLDTTSTDLFSSAEQPSLELFESPAQTGDELDLSLESSSTDLFNSVETDSNLELFESPPQTAEQLDFSLDTTSTDLFSSAEQPSLELFESPAQTGDELDLSLESSSTDLFNSVETDSNLELFESPPQTAEQLDFSLDTTSTDLFSSAEQPSLGLFESPAQTGDELDLSLESSSTDLFNSVETDSNLELFESPPQTAEQLDFSLDTTSTDLFSSAEQPSLGLFESPAQTGDELDLSLESSSTDLFNLVETDSNLELFESPAQTGDELDLSLDSSTDLFSSAEQPSLELFESPAQTGDELDLSLESSSTDLFNLVETDSNLELFESPPQTAEQLDFSLDTTSTDLFSSAEQPSLELFESPAQTGDELDLSLESSSTDLFNSVETDSNLELFESPAQTGEQLDFSLDTTSTNLFSSAEQPSLELFESPAQTGDELDFSLDTTSTDLFSSAEQPSLELFESPEQTGDELDLSLESSSTDLFNLVETDSNLELFESPAQTAEQLDLSLDSSTDLFSSAEQPSLELFESPAQTGDELDLSLDSSTDLFSSAEQPSLELFESPAQTGDELDLSLESSSTDLFNLVETDSNLELFESPAQTGDELDFSLESSSTDLFSSAEQPSLELFESPAQTGDELDFSLDSNTDLFSSAENDSNLELFVAPTENTSELDFRLETSNTDLFSSTQIDSNLEFDQPADTPSVENSADLMAFDLINSTEMALEDELNNRVEMGVEDMPSQHEDSAASVVSELEVEGELPAAFATESVADDFAELEALLEEESTSSVVAIAQELFDLNTPIPPVTTAAPQSSNDEFDDLEMLLQETPTTPATPEPVKPQKPAQKPATTNSRRSVFEQMMRVPVKQLDSISNQVGELVVYRNSLEQDQERLRQFLDNLLHQVQQLGDVGSRMQELYERSLVEASLLTSRTGSHSTSIDPTPASKGHVTGINFDALEMDRFTGFHTLAQEMIELIVRVREASSDIEFVTGETEQVARQFRQVTTQLQEGITRSRMVPFSQIAERLPRAVRDISLKYGKQAELVIEGKDTLIDKVILEQLYDPMTHLVNNAITHGIESSQERSKNGKSPVGQITIRAFHQGNQTVITVSDDGAGIDPERVKAKAIKNGLITPEAANNMSRLDVYNLLFHAGFSTKDAVDEFAGRGVGMDVVLTSLSQIRGTITTDSTLGKGTTFTIRLPLTLSICKALCCLSDKARVAFPMDGVEQMIDIPQESVITNAQGQTCIPWHDSLLPFRHLREFLSFNRQISRGNIYGSSRDDNMISVIVLRSADMFFAIQVDQVLGEQEIVIKQFEGPAPKPVGIAGATILGDGRIMPIADVLELIDLSMGRIRQQGEGTWWTPNDPSLPPETTSTTRTEPMVLIVDDSITVRELLSMTFVNAGYRVEQARDGQEAWDKLRDGLPCDLIFCDIEMPKMDGLELLSRKQQDPKLCQLPIAMLTSRGSDRHRQMALQLGASGYFTKPYLEEALLDGAQRMLKGEVLITPSASSV